MRFSKPALSKIGLMLATTVFSGVGIAHAFTTGYMGTVRPLSNWKVGKIDALAHAGAQTAFCASTNSFEQGVKLVLAKNAKGDVSLAINFEDARYIAGQTLPVRLEHINDYALNVKAHVATPKSIVLQLGQGTEFIDALSGEGYLDISLPDVDMRVSLFTIAQSLKKLQTCADSFPMPVQEIEEVRAVVPDAPFAAEGETLASAQPKAETLDIKAETLLVEEQKLETNVMQVEQDVTSDEHVEERIVALSSELSALVETQAGQSDSQNTVQQDKTQQRIEALERQLSQAMAEKEAQAEKAAELEKRLMAREGQINSNQDESRRARIDALGSSTVQMIDGKPLVVIQRELMNRQADIERQAQAQAKEAEWIERRRLELEKVKGAESASGTQELLDRLEALQTENEKLKQDYKTTRSQVGRLNLASDQFSEQKKLSAPVKENATQVKENSQVLEEKLAVQNKRLDALRSQLEFKEAEISSLQKTIEGKDQNVKQDVKENVVFAPAKPDVPVVAQPETSKIIWSGQEQVPPVEAEKQVNIDWTPVDLGQGMGKSLEGETLKTRTTANKAPRKIAPVEQAQPIRQVNTEIQAVQSMADDLPVTVISSDANVVMTPKQPRKPAQVQDLGFERGYVTESAPLPQSSRLSQEDADLGSASVADDSYLRARTLVDELMQRYQPQAGGNTGYEDISYDGQQASLMIYESVGIENTPAFALGIQDAPQTVNAFVNEQPIDLTPPHVQEAAASKARVISADITQILGNAGVEISGFTGDMISTDQGFEKSWLSSSYAGTFAYLEGAQDSEFEAAIKDYAQNYLKAFDEAEGSELNIQPLSDGLYTIEASYKKGDAEKFVAFTAFNYADQGIAVISHDGQASAADEVAILNLSIAETVVNNGHHTGHGFAATGETYADDDGFDLRDLFDSDAKQENYKINI